jgi:hypothetical protein
MLLRVVTLQFFCLVNAVKAALDANDGTSVLFQNGIVVIQSTYRKILAFLTLEIR